MRIIAAFLMVATLAGLALAGDCATPYRRSTYQRSYAPPAYHDDVVIFTNFQLLTPPAAAVVPTTTTTAAAASSTAAPAVPSLDDGPPVVTSASLIDVGAAAPGAAVEVLRTNCAKCHGAKASGGVTIFNGAGQFAPSRDPMDLLEAVLSGAMPPTGKLSATDKKTLRQLLKG